MKLHVLITLSIALLFSCFIFMKAYAAIVEPTAKSDLEEEIIDEGPLTPQREEIPEEEAPPPEEKEEEEAPPEETPVAKPPKLPPAGAAREGEEKRQVVIDSLVNLNYVFNNSSDSFILKYHLHLEGDVAAATAVVKGKAQIATEVTGFLAKWPNGECKLSVNIPDSQFEMTFRKTSDEKANIDLKFTTPIIETWESLCSFKDAPDAKFNTKGDPEKWLAKAFEKARPPLTRLSANLNPEESTTMKFEISKQTIKDPPLGTAEIDGTGVITVNPEKQQKLP